MSRTGDVEGVEPRAAALRVITGVDRGGRSDRLLDVTLRARTLNDPDRRLATEIVYGALRRQATLDRSVQPFCNRPIARLDHPTRGALRVAAYQCAYLTSVPAHAAVHATVEALKRVRPRAVPFANAVLRSWLRAGADLDPGDGSWGARLDVPPWLAARFEERYGREVAERWFEAALRPAPRALRVHPRKIDLQAASAALSAAGVSVQESPVAAGCLRVLEGNPASTALWAEGSVTPRGEAAVMVTDLLDSGDGGWLLDACCGRGGKAVQLAERGRGAVLGLDLDRERLGHARRAAGRAAADELHLACADVRVGVPARGRFERILVDAPCSGLGTLRRHPEIKWRVDPERLRRQAQDQRRILARAAAALAPGGRLLYVTCATEPEENEEVVAAVVAADPELERLPLEDVAGGRVDAVGDLRTYPYEPDLDGFFAARVVRRPGRAGSPA